MLPQLAAIFPPSTLSLREQHTHTWQYNINRKGVCVCERAIEGVRERESEGERAKLGGVEGLVCVCVCVCVCGCVCVRESKRDKKKDGVCVRGHCLEGFRVCVCVCVSLRSVCVCVCVCVCV